MREPLEGDTVKELAWESIRILFTVTDPDDYFAFYRVTKQENTMVIEEQAFETYDIGVETDEFHVQVERYNLTLGDVPFFSAVFRPEFLQFGMDTVQFEEIKEIECIGLISPRRLVEELSRELNGLDREHLVKILSIIQLNGELLIDREDFINLRKMILEPNSQITTVTGPFGPTSHQIDGIQIGINELPASSGEIETERFAASLLINSFSNSPNAEIFELGDAITEFVQVRDFTYEEDDDPYEEIETGRLPGFLARFTIASRWLYVDFEEKVDIDSWFDEDGPQHALIHEGWIRHIQVLKPWQFGNFQNGKKSEYSNQKSDAIEFPLFNEIARW